MSEAGARGPEVDPSEDLYRVPTRAERRTLEDWWSNSRSFFSRGTNKASGGKSSTRM